LASKRFREGFNLARKLQTLSIVFSAMKTQKGDEYIVRMIVKSTTMQDIMIDMFPQTIKNIYEKCVEIEREGLKPVTKM
jgi:hypothetical protein